MLVSVQSLARVDHAAAIMGPAAARAAAGLIAQALA